MAGRKKQPKYPEILSRPAPVRGLTVKQVLDGVRDLMGKYAGDERELLEELHAEAEGWRMRLEELEGD
jgi:hypothetical protein